MREDSNTQLLVLPDNLMLSHMELSVPSPHVPEISAVSSLTLERVARRHHLMRNMNSSSKGRWFGESISGTRVHTPRLEKTSKKPAGAQQRSNSPTRSVSPTKRAQRPDRPQTAAPAYRVRARRQRPSNPDSSSGSPSLRRGHVPGSAEARPEAEESPDEADSPTIAGRAGIGSKGGIKPIMGLLQPMGDPTSGSRLLAAMTLEQLADSEDNGVLIASIGVEVAEPVMQLLRSGNGEEKILAAKILARTCKVPRHRVVVGASPGLISALEGIFLREIEASGQQTADRLMGAACDLLAEIGRVPLISAWVSRSPAVVEAMACLTQRSDSPEGSGPAESALWGLASLASASSVALQLVDSAGFLSHLVRLAGSSQEGVGPAATAVISELAVCEECLPKLNDVRPVPAVLRQVRASEGMRTTLGLCLRGLSRLLEHQPLVKPFFDEHGAAVLLELLIYIRVSDEELLHLNLMVLGKVSRVKKYHAVLLHNGLVLQVLPLLQWGTHETVQHVLAILHELAAETTGSSSIVGAGGVSLITAALSQEDCPAEVRVAGFRLLASLGELDANRAAVARMGIPVILRELWAGNLPDAQAAGCECLAHLALTTEIKMMMMHTGVVDAVLGVLYQVEGKAECEHLRNAAAKTLYNFSADLDKSMVDIMQNGTQQEIGQAFIGARVVTRHNVRKLMDVLRVEKHSDSADIASWLQDTEFDKQEAAAKVVAKLPVTRCSELLRAKPECLKVLVQHMGSWNPTLMGASASALCQLALLGEEARARMVNEGVIPHLIQLAQMHAKEARTAGIKLMQRLAEDEPARAVIVDKGGMEALLDLVEHSPDPAGRVAAVKALTNLALSDTCRSNMTARGLKPILDMISPEVSPPEGQEAALRTLQNMASNEDNAMLIAEVTLPHMSDMLSSPHVGVKLASGKLLRNLACYKGADKRVASVVVPEVPALLNTDDIQLIHMACQLVECLCKRPEVRNAWIEDHIPAVLTKILLLGDTEARHYAARALNRLGAGLDADLWDRVQHALKWKPEPTKKKAANKPAWKLLKAEVIRLGIHNELSGESSRSNFARESDGENGRLQQSWAATINALQARQGEPLPPHSPHSAGPVQSTARRGHSQSRPSSRPSSAVSNSSWKTVASKSSVSRSPSSSRSNSRPSSAGYFWQRQTGWEHRGDALRSPSVKSSTASSRQASPPLRTNSFGLGVQGSLAVMRSPLDMTAQELTLPRTKREAPRLWKDLKGAARLLSLHKSIARGPSSKMQAEGGDGDKGSGSLTPAGAGLAVDALKMLGSAEQVPQERPDGTLQAKSGAPAGLRLESEADTTAAGQVPLPPSPSDAGAPANPQQPENEPPGELLPSTQALDIAAADGDGGGTAPVDSASGPDEPSLAVPDDSTDAARPSQSVRNAGGQHGLSSLATGGDGLGLSVAPSTSGEYFPSAPATHANNSTQAPRPQRSLVRILEQLG